MQKLYFEPAWDKTIAPADRDKITNHFQSQQLKNDVHLAFLWEAINHKGDQLVTVLIHNSEDTSLHLQDTTITYTKDNKQIASGIFTLPLILPPKTSMPWTFIFSTTNRTTQTLQYSIVHKN